MKSHIIKIVACLMFVGVFQFTHAQAAASKPAQSDNVELDPAKHASDLVDRIASEVQLTNTQKTKLLDSMNEAIATYTAALKRAKKEDESKLSTINSNLIADMTARIKGILTPEQFNTVMSKENSSQ